MWESKDDRKWGHDKFEELTVHERSYREVNILHTLLTLVDVYMLVCALSFNLHFLLFMGVIISRAGEVLGDVTEAVVGIELQAVDMHKETCPQNSPIMAPSTITIRIVLLRVLEGEDLKGISRL